MAASPSTSQPDLLAQSSASIISIDSNSLSDLASLSNDVDHIKELIGLSNAGQSESISHSIFRRSSRVYISQSQILKELDRLKRRLHKASIVSPAVARDAVDPEDEDEKVLEPADEAQVASEVGRLKSEIERITKEREEWIEGAERRIDEATDKQVVASRRAESSETELKALKARNEATESEIGQLKVGFAILRDQHDGTLASLEEAQGALKDAKNEHHTLLEAHEKTSSELQSSQATIKELETKYAAISESFEKLEQSFSELTQTQSDTARLQTELQAKLDAKVEENAVLVDELRSLRDNVKQLETARAVLSKLHEDVNKQLEKTREASHNLQIERDATKQENLRLSRELQTSAKDLAAAKRKLSDDEARTSEMSKSIKSLEGEVVSLSDAAKANKEQIEHDTKRIRDAEKRTQTLTMQLEAEQKATVDKLQQVQDDNARSERASALEKSELQKRSADLTTELTNTTKQLEEARKECSDATSQIKKFQLQVEGLQKDCVKASDQAEKLQEQLETSQKVSSERLEKVQIENTSLQKELNKDKTVLEGKLADLTAELADSFQQLQTSQTEMSEVKAKAAQSQAELKEAIEKTKSEHSQATQSLEECRAELSAKQDDINERLTYIKSLEQTKDAIAQDLAEHKKDLKQSQALVEENQQKSKQEIEIKLSEIAKSHKAELSKMQEKLDSADKELKTRLSEVQAEAAGKAAKHLSEAKAKAAKHASDVHDAHERTLAELRQTHEDEKLAASKAFDMERLSIAENANKANEERIKSLQQEAEANLSSARSAAAEELKKVKDKLLQDLAELKSGHAAAIESLGKANTDEERNLREQLSAKVAEVSSQLSSAEANHHSELGKMENTHKRALAEAAKKHEDAYRNLQNKYDNQTAQNEKQQHDNVRLAALNTKRSATLNGLKQALARAQTELAENDKSHQSELRILHEKHAEETSNAEKRFEQAILSSDAASAEMLERHDKDMAELELKLRQELDSSKQNYDGKLQRSLEESATNLQGMKRSHGRELEELRKELSEQHEERVSDLSKTHQVRLDRLEEFYGAETTKARGDFTNQLAQTNQSHAEELEGQQQAHEERLQDMQEQFRCKLEETKRIHSRKISEIEIEASQNAKVAEEQHHLEMKELRLQLTAQQSDIHGRFSQKLSEYKTLTDDRDKLAQEIATLRDQCKQDEQERHARETELEGQLASVRADAGAARLQIQTLDLAKQALEESVIKNTQEHSNTVAKLEARLATAVENEGRAHNEKMALATQLEKTLHNAAHADPTVPKTDIGHSHTQSEQLEDKRTGVSFEQYLSQAQTELSELGKVISQNEAAFAQKIAQHVGDLQMAKNQLALEYKHKFDELVKERQHLEEDATTKHSRELEKAQDALKMGFGPLTPPPSSRKDQELPRRQTENAHKDNGRLDVVDQGSLALERAESHLVAEHHSQLVKRKSQIALSHASRFAALAAEYDAAIARLFDDRDDLGGDLGISPDAFENTLSRLDEESFRLENERAASVGQGSPATPFPDAASIHGSSPAPALNWQQRDTFHQKQQEPHGSPGSFGSPHTYRPSSPADGPIPRRTVASPRSSPRWARSTGDREMNFGPTLDTSAVSPGGGEGFFSKTSGLRLHTQSPSAEPKAHRHLRHASGKVSRAE